MCLSVQQRATIRWLQRQPAVGSAVTSKLDRRSTDAVPEHSQRRLLRRRAACFRFANPAAEQLFGASWNVLAGRQHARVRRAARDDHGAGPAGTGDRHHDLGLWHRACPWRAARRSAVDSHVCPCPGAARSMCWWCCIPAPSRVGSTSRSPIAARPARSPASPRRWRMRSRTRFPDPRRRPTARAGRGRGGPAADPADLRRDRPDLRPGRAHGGVRRHWRRSSGARSTSIRCSSMSAASPQAGFARHAPHRRALRSLAARGRRRPRPAASRCS